MLIQLKLKMSSSFQTDRFENYIVKIPVYIPNIGEREREYVLDCVDSGWVSSRGAYIDKFESAFAAYIGVDYVTSVSNGTVALHLALEAIGIGPGDEVIVPTFTYVASVNAIHYVGAIPVYVDSYEDSCQVDCEDIEAKITDRTKAVMAVHLYGQSCNMEKITSLCNKHNLKLIEDCAEAVGTKFDGKHVGGFGDVATFSFFGNKTITTGEGGMVAFKNEADYKLGFKLKTQGVDPDKEYWHDVIAYNYRMTNICAAIGFAQMEVVDKTVARKREIASIYKDRLTRQRLPLRFHDEVYGTSHSYWMCSIILDDSSKVTELRDKLREMGIDTRPFFHPAHTLPHLQEATVYPIAEKLSKSGINLPSYPIIKDSELDFICDAIVDFFNHYE